MVIRPSVSTTRQSTTFGSGLRAGLETTSVATFLDVLADLLGEPEARSRYRSDPVAWLRALGSGHLCGEDVLAGLPVLAGWFPDLGDRTEGLESYGAGPLPGESELDAAVRTIDAILERIERGSAATPTPDP
jgi:hypothetical protein